MLVRANVQKEDFVVDLGCGDGRIPVTAARKYGAHGLGVDIDPVRIAEATANAKAAGVEHLVTFKLQDAMTTDVRNATLVTTYLLVGRQPQVASDPDEGNETRHANRHAQFQHGRLGAGEVRDVQGRRGPLAHDFSVSTGW
jgi:predicted RNA methylase